MTALDVAVLGAGGFAREVRWAVDSGRTVDGRALRTVAFVEPTARTEPLKGLPVVTLEQLDPSVLLICGIGGMTEIKQRVVQDALEHGFAFTPAVLAAGVVIGPDVTIGTGSIVCAGTILTCDITVGEHVAVNLSCTIGHDAVLEDFVTVSPGVHVSGWDVLARGAYLGTGATVIEGLRVGADAVLGAGAVAIKDVPDRALATGVPAVVKKADRFA